MIESVGFHIINCPYCVEQGKPTPDTKKHLYVYGPGRGVHCFRCGFHRSRVVPGEVCELLSDADFVVEGQIGERRTYNLRDSTEWILRSAKPVTNFRSAVKYLEERGITTDEMERLGLLYAPTGDYAKRVIFTIRRDTDGPVVYFTGRSIRKNITPKYKNAPVPKDGFLYMVGQGDRGIICEGPFDAIKAAQAGYTGIALLGKTCNTAQAQSIGRTVRSATVILDPDAFAKSVDVSVKLSYYVPTNRKELPGGQDLGDLTKATIRAIMEPGGGVRAALLGEDDVPIYRGIDLRYQGFKMGKS